MDALALVKAEMEAKRKAVSELAGERKYVKRSEMESIREAKYLQEQREQEQQKLAKKAAAAPVSVAAVPQAAAEGSTSSSDALLDAVASTDSVASKAENDGQAGEISSKEVIKRLRRRGEPIRLFGESDDDRVKRLRALEHATKDETMAAQNVFRANIKLMDKKLDLDALQRNADDDHHKEEKEKRKKAGMLLPIEDEAITVHLFEKEKSKVYHLMHNYIAKLVLEWEANLDSLPEEVKRTSKGKSDYVTMVQCKDDLQALFKLLRKRTLSDDLLLHLTRIVEYMQARDYVHASDIYYLLSIGNAPWPIGVTMVGIHERSAREKIFSNQVAHALNDEKTRKWIHSLKRLMTFCQEQYLPDDLAKTVGYIPQKK